VEVAQADKPFWQRGSFWTGPFLYGIGLLVAVAAGVAWYAIGGLPRGHADYGSLAVPGRQVMALPDGEVRINFEGDATGSGDNRSIQDQPDGLAVRVTPASGGAPLAVDDVPSWLFSSLSGDRGNEPFGKIDVPGAGSYRVQATADEFGGFDSPAARRNVAGTDSGPEITLGKEPWNPLGSPVLGAIVVACLVGLLEMLLLLPVRLLR